MNSVQLVGRVATKPSTASLPNQTAVVTFRIAVSRARRAQDDHPTTDFFTISAHGRLAEAQLNHLEVGRIIAVTGRLRSAVNERSGDADGGGERVDVVASSIEWIGWVGAVSS